MHDGTAPADLRKNPLNWKSVDQLLDCSSSVGANYRGACRGRSRAEFIAKLGVAVEEIDESVYWLEFLLKAGAATAEGVAPHIDEAQQLRAILAKSYGTAKANHERDKAKPRKSQITKSLNR
ncbi:MAG: four helix bundle protein [Vicinamibacterales bacterium]